MTSRGSTRPRVLWLIKGLGPGGAEQLLVNQARVRDSAAVDIQVAYLIPWKDHHVDTLRDLGIDVTCLDAPRELDPRWTIRLRQLIVRQNIDVVHVHSPYVAAVTRVVLRSFRPSHRPALVYTEHNRWERHNAVTRMMNRLTIRCDDLDLAVSADVRSSMSDAAARHAHVLIHGIDADDVRRSIPERHAVRHELGIDDPADVIVGIVANFRKEKAYDVWLRAAELALAADPRLRFVSVGQGPLEEQFRAAVDQSPFASSISVLGYRSDAIRVMNSFDIFTLTSIHEGLPVSLMDALALGLPVVATSVGGIPEAVDDGIEGLLVASGDAAGLADAYVELARDPERRRAMRTAAIERSANFDVVTTQRRLEATYRSMAARRRL